MGTITERISEYIRDILTGWVLSSLESLFGDLNNKVGMITGTVSQSPETWNPAIFNMIRNVSDTVIVPIAGMAITGVLCYELISVVIDKNNMHEIESWFIFRYLFKACIAVFLLTHTVDIVMGIFEIGSTVTARAGGFIGGSTNINIGPTLVSMYSTQMAAMTLGELFGLGIQIFIASFLLQIMAVLIIVVIYGRLIEIYIYVSIAPLSFATLANREWGNIGINYVQGLLALSFQGFFMMICVGIYAALVSNVTVSGDLNGALWSVIGYSVLLIFSLFKVGSVSKAIFGAHQ
ncbi:MAG: hypothetical protein K5985_01860 [Lachnospiraceae bacterium]|nr:hypothetical protein [Lachnospiraceae bacterium]